MVLIKFNDTGKDEDKDCNPYCVGCKEKFSDTDFVFYCRSMNVLICDKCQLESKDRICGNLIQNFHIHRKGVLLK